MFTWPWRRFEEMFRRHLARVELEKLERGREMMVCAIDSNPNYDGNEGSEAKRARIESIDESFASISSEIRARARGEKLSQADDVFEEDPLFAVYRRGPKNVVYPTTPEAGAGAVMLEN